MNQGRDLCATKEQITDAALTRMPPPVPSGTVMLSFKLSVGKVGISRVPLFTNEAIAALPIRAPHRLIPDFLYWALRSMDFSHDTDRAAMGATLNKAKLHLVKVPVPPIEEQRRIADILDRADDLRAKRRDGLAHLDDLAESIFLDMFGDTPASTGRVVPVEQFLVFPLRNGLSPATAGTVRGEVLTLAAITGERFDVTAVKQARFAREPRKDQRVRTADLLICRGNGNLTLVGRGAFPTVDMQDTAFPDTVIAARFNLKRVDPEYVQHVWNSRVVRRQIESMARTTNGTFKVNQTMLERVQLPDPGIEAQQRFGAQSRRIEAMRRDQQAQLDEVDELFDSLQHRAFAGLL